MTVSIPTLNGDCVEIINDEIAESFHVAPEDRMRLFEMIGDLAELIDEESGVSREVDLRFLIPLSMRFLEQAGRKAFMHPRGNNPYNIMGTGPAGSFERPGNMEVIDGQRVNRPAKFAMYAAERDGVKTFLEMLQTAHEGAWVGAFDAVANGTSFEAFAQGLRPHGHPHYLTEPLARHLGGLRARGRELLNLLELMYKNEREMVRKQLVEDEILLPALVGHPFFEEDLKKRMKERRENIAYFDGMLSQIAATRKNLQAEGEGRLEGTLVPS